MLYTRRLNPFLLLRNICNDNESSYLTPEGIFVQLYGLACLEEDCKVGVRKNVNLDLLGLEDVQMFRTWIQSTMSTALYINSVCLPSYTDSCTSEENIAAQKIGVMVDWYNEVISNLNEVEEQAKSTCTDDSGGCLFVEVKQDMTCKQTGQVLANASQIVETMSYINQAAAAVSNSVVVGNTNLYTDLVESISNSSIPAATSIAFSKIDINLENALDGSFLDSVTLAANVSMESILSTATSMQLILANGLAAFSNIQGRLRPTDTSFLNIYQERIVTTLKSYVAFTTIAIGESSTVKETSMIDFR